MVKITGSKQYLILRWRGLSRVVLPRADSQGGVPLQSIVCLEADILSQDEEGIEEVWKRSFFDIQFPLSLHSGPELDQELSWYQTTCRFDSSRTTQTQLLSTLSHQESLDWTFVPDPGPSGDRQNSDLCQYRVPLGEANQKTSACLRPLECSRRHVGPKDTWNWSQSAQILF